MIQMLKSMTLKGAALACLGAVSIISAFAQGGPQLKTDEQTADGSPLSYEPNPSRVVTTIETEQDPKSKSVVQVPPLPPADALGLNDVSLPAQRSLAKTSSDNSKQIDPKTTTVTAADTTTVTTTAGSTASTTSDSHTSQSVVNASLQQGMPATSAIATPAENKQNESSIQRADSTLLVPNGAALQTQMLPLVGAADSPWTSYTAGTFLILGIAAAGLILVRIRQGKSFGANHAERQMQLISSLSLSPKRQILLVRIRDREVAVATTEHGMTVLTEIPMPTARLSRTADLSEAEEPRRKRVQARMLDEEPQKLVASNFDPLGEETAVARSEMLMGALKNLREKNLRGRDNSKTSEGTVQSHSSPSDAGPNEKKPIEAPNEGQRKSKGESTLKQNRTAFPKYLANSFEQESKRTIAQDSPNSKSNGNKDETNNVTNMIRERLKELRPLA